VHRFAKGLFSLARAPRPIRRLPTLLVEQAVPEQARFDFHSRPFQISGGAGEIFLDAGLVRGHVMPIRQFLGTGDAIQPDDLTVMNTAFSAALTKLGLTDRQDPLVEIVAAGLCRRC
jgi:hypothetical protein